MNTAAPPVRVVLLGRVSAVAGRRSVRVVHRESLVWAEAVGAAPVLMRFGFDLPPGETVLVFSTDQPAEKIGTDPRELAFRAMNLEIVVTPASVPR